MTGSLSGVTGVSAALVIGIDGSFSAQQALRWALAEAAPGGCSLRLVRVVCGQRAGLRLGIPSRPAGRLAGDAAHGPLPPPAGMSTRWPR